MKQKKPRLLEFLKENGISIYKVCQIMGDDPIANQTKWSKRITGKGSMSREDLESICEKLTLLFKDERGETKEIKPEMFKRKAYKYIM